MFEIISIIFREYSMNFAIITLASIALIFFVLKILLSRTNSIRIMIISIIVYILLFITGVAVIYVSNNEYIFYNSDKYRISGKVMEINDKYLNLYIIKSDLSANGVSHVKVKFNDETSFLIYTNGKEMKVNREEILSNSNVEIICKESKILNGAVTALKVTKKVY